MVLSLRYLTVIFDGNKKMEKFASKSLSSK
jgi:hypothetical protein